MYIHALYVYIYIYCELYSIQLCVEHVSSAATAAVCVSRVGLTCPVATATASLSKRLPAATGWWTSCAATSSHWCAELGSWAYTIALLFTVGPALLDCEFPGDRALRFALLDLELYVVVDYDLELFGSGLRPCLAAVNDEPVEPFFWPSFSHIFQRFSTFCMLDMSFDDDCAS